MYRRKFAYIAAMFVSAALLLVTGCVRDDVDEGGGEYPDLGPEDYALAIDFDLGIFPSENGGGSTRSNIGRITRVNFHPEVTDHEYWENYIDLFHEMHTYSGDSYSLHVLLFDEDNNFLFNPQGELKGGVTNTFYVSQTTPANAEYKRWRVVFQAPKEVREYVSSHKFKVAIFANWPTDPVYNSPKGIYEPPMPDEFMTGEPWGGETHNPEKGGTPISIRKLARSVWDSTYGGTHSKVYYIVTDMEAGEPMANDGSHMGPFTQWVLNYHSSEDDAVSFIRGFTPDELGHDRAYYEKEWASSERSDREVTPRVFRRNFKKEFSTDDRIFIYQNLWNLWNFGGLYNTDINGASAGPTDENKSLKDDGKNWQSRELGSNYDFGYNLGLDKMYYGRPSYIGVWASRNHRRAVHSLGKAADGTTPLVEYIGENGGEQEITKGSFDFVSVEPIDEILDYNSQPVEPTVAGGALEYYKASQNAKLGKDDYGVYLKLPATNAPLKGDNKTVYENKYDYLHFRVFANSVLYIKTDNVEDLQIESTAYNFSKNYYSGENEDGRNTWFLDIRAEAKDVYIMSKSGNAKIYEIELIQKKYLYDSDRRTMLPSEHQLIPMYGIQEYEPLGDYWIPGYVFDLSHDNGFHRPGYDYRTIYLLRSVSRVEVLVSKEFETKAMSENGRYLPRLLMRSMNRYARCMPLDVVSPTNEVWEQVDQEILNIREHGPFYVDPKEYPKGPNGEVSEAEQEEFRNRLAWFYSRWVTMWNWDWNGWRPTTMNTSLEPPRVYNAKISRSDYVRLIKVDDNYEGMYERYILYMPEKAIDDATDAGELTGTPKVPHIEVRLKGEPVDNLDDNKHDRIYFMDYAATGGPTDVEYGTEPDATGKDWDIIKYDDYEKSAEHLSKHWPIVRNHIYRFRVHPSSSDNINVTLEVSGAASRDVTIPNFD